MNEELLLFNMLDMAGTFAFAISGAVAARQKNLDLFGIIAIAYIVACGGGIIRDVCIGAIPPAGLADWRYLALALVASALAMVAYPLLQRLDHRSEEHTSELQSLLRISYDVLCLKKKKT